MIHPVNAFNTSVGFKKSKERSKKNNSITDTHVAMINATGVAIATGGLMTVIARSHTPSWGSASAVGVFGAILAWFFMTPQLVCKNVLKQRNKKNIAAETGSLTFKETSAAKNLKYLKPAQKIIQFKQS